MVLRAAVVKSAPVLNESVSVSCEVMVCSRTKFSKVVSLLLILKPIGISVPAGMLSQISNVTVKVMVVASVRWHEEIGEVMLRMCTSVF